MEKKPAWDSKCVKNHIIKKFSGDILVLIEARYVASQSPWDK